MPELKMSVVKNVGGKNARGENVSGKKFRW